MKMRSSSILVLAAVMGCVGLRAADYHFAEGGSDANDGLAPATALRTIDRLNALDLKPGDRVLFRRGDLFRGAIKARNGVTYTAYGEGADLPTICASKRDYADPKLWERTDEPNVWRCTEKLHNVGIVLFDREPRQIDGEPVVADMRLPKRSEPFDKPVVLDADLTFRNLFRKDRLELRSDKGNPGERFRHIEIGEHGHCLWINADDLLIENLHLTLSGSHGVGGSGDRRNITVRNCRIEWLGGSIIEGWRFGTVRFGNAIEIWGGCDGFRVHDNFIHDIYDTGVTVQCNDRENFVCRIQNVEFRDNVIERCFWGLEYYNKNNAPGSFTRSLHFIGNVCRDIGLGWGCKGREWRAPAIQLAETPEGSADILVEGNVFDGSTGSLVDLREPYPKGAFVFRGNTYRQRKGGVLIRRTPERSSFSSVLGRESTVELPFGDDAAEVIRRELGDDGSGNVEALAIYFPGWAPTPAFEAEYGKGWDEWRLVATPRKILPGQKLPLELQSGVLKGTEPKDCAKEIDLAADAGIDAFLFCWYWYGRNGERPFDETLEQGFLKAPNRDRIKFALMWCFHPIGAHPFRPPLEGGSDKMRFMPEGTPEEFLAAIDYCLAHYFRKPNYWTREGRLYFSIYNAGDFLKKIGGREKARAVLAAADARVRAAGLPGLYFNAINASPSQSEDLKAAGFKTLSHYSPPNFYGRIVKEPTEIPYDDVAAALKETCAKFDGAALPYVPSVPTGWDSSMRCASEEPWPWRKSCRYPYYGIVTGNTPDKFRDLLAWAKRRVASDPKKPGVVQICAWNEYTEGCYLVPDNHDGTGMLDAVREVFGVKKPIGKDVALNEVHRGMTLGFYAPAGWYGSQEARDDVDRIAAMGATWIVLVPNVWQEGRYTTVQFNDFMKSQSDLDILDLCDYIHAKGLHVTLRPMLECFDGTDRMYIDFENDVYRLNPRHGSAGNTYCSRWFASMKARTIHYAAVAERCRCEAFCIDSELDRMADYAYNAYWKEIVSEVRKVYTGALTSCHTRNPHHGVRWDECLSHRDFWLYDLDYLQISDYRRPVKDYAERPHTVEEMVEGFERDWLPFFRDLAKRYGKPIQVGEFGCTSVKAGARSPAGSPDISMAKRVRAC